MVDENLNTNKDSNDKMAEQGEEEIIVPEEKEKKKKVKKKVPFMDKEPKLSPKEKAEKEFLESLKKIQVMKGALEKKDTEADEELTPHEIERVKEGLQAVKEGRVVSSEEMMKKFAKKTSEAKAQLETIYPSQEPVNDPVIQQIKQGVEKSVKENNKKVKPEKVPTQYVKVTIDQGKKLPLIVKLVKKEAIFELAKRDYKIKEDKKKIAGGEVAIMFLRDNGIGDIKYMKPENGMFLVNGNYYHQIEACVHSIGPKRIPMAVIPEWSMTPLSKLQFADLMGAEPQLAQKLIIKSIEHAEIVKIDKELAPNKPANTKALLWGIIGLVVAVYMINKFFGGG